MMINLFLSAIKAPIVLSRSIAPPTTMSLPITLVASRAVAMHTANSSSLGIIEYTAMVPSRWNLSALTTNPSDLFSTMTISEG
jgi:hypothetical protein